MAPIVDPASLGIPPPPEFQPDPLPPASPFTEGWTSGVEGLKSSLAGAAAALAGGFGAKATEQKALAYAKEHEARAGEGARKVEDIGGVGDAVDYTKWALGNVLPSSLAFLGAAAVGRGVGALATRNAALAATKDFARNVGAGVGGMAASTLLEAGQIYPNAVESGVENPALRTAIGAPISALGDLAPDYFIAKRLGLFGAKRAMQDVVGKGGWKGAALNSAKDLATVAPLEGAGETYQAYVERVAAGQPTTGPEARSDYLNSFFPGLIGGSMILPASAVTGYKGPPGQEPAPDVSRGTIAQEPVAPPGAPAAPVAAAPTVTPSGEVVTTPAAAPPLPPAGGAPASAPGKSFSHVGEADAAHRDLSASLEALNAELAKPAKERAKGRTKQVITQELRAVQQHMDDIEEAAPLLPTGEGAPIEQHAPYLNAVAEREDLHDQLNKINDRLEASNQFKPEFREDSPEALKGMQKQAKDMKARLDTLDRQLALVRPAGAPNMAGTPPITDPALANFPVNDVEAQARARAGVPSARAPQPGGETLMDAARPRLDRAIADNEQAIKQRRTEIEAAYAQREDQRFQKAQGQANDQNLERDVRVGDAAGNGVQDQPVQGALHAALEKAGLIKKPETTAPTEEQSPEEKAALASRLSEFQVHRKLRAGDADGITDEDLMTAMRRGSTTVRKAAMKEMGARLEFDLSAGDLGGSNASTVRGDQESGVGGGQAPEGGGASGGGDIQQAPGAGSEADGAELRKPDEGVRGETKKLSPRNDPFLKWIHATGGINPRYAEDLTGEKGFRSNNLFPGLFRKSAKGEGGSIIAGHGLDDIATRAADAGWISPAEVDSVDGGTEAVANKIRNALAGERPTNANDEDAAFEKMRLQRENAALDRMIADDAEYKGLGATTKEQVDYMLDRYRALFGDDHTESVLERIAIKAGGESEESYQEQLKTVLDDGFSRLGQETYHGGSIGADAKTDAEGEGESNRRYLPDTGETHAQPSPDATAGKVSFEQYNANLKAEQARRIKQIGPVGDYGIMRNTNPKLGWQAVLENASGEGGWRTQSFDENGFFSHALYKDKADAIAAAAADGFIERDDSALDRLQDTHGFQRGNQASDIIRRANSKEIDWETANKEIAKLGAAVKTGTSIAEMEAANVEAKATKVVADSPKKLTEADTQALAKHYDAAGGTDEFKASLHADVVRYIDQDAPAIPKSIRSIITKLAKQARQEGRAENVNFIRQNVPEYQTDLFGSTTLALKPLTRDQQQFVKDNLVKFSSGLNSADEFDKAGNAVGGQKTAGIGIEVGRLADKNIPALAERVVDNHVQLFVDSGAFGVFRKTLKGDKVEALDFGQIFDKYDAILGEIGNAKRATDGEAPAVLMVMPDVVGNQAASLALIETHKEQISAYVNAPGLVRPIIPIQKGEMSLKDAYKKVVDILGTADFIVGIPSNEEAATNQDVAEFLRDTTIDEVHVLGATSDAKLTPRLEAIAASGRLEDMNYLSADASQIRSNVIQKGQTRDERLTKVAKYSMNIEEAAKETGVTPAQFVDWLEGRSDAKGNPLVKKQSDKPAGPLFEGNNTAPEHAHNEGKPLDDEVYQPTASKTGPDGERQMNPTTIERDTPIVPMTISREAFKEITDEWSTLFADPEERVITEQRAKKAGIITLAEAEKRIDSWKAHARAQTGNSNRTVLSLFDLTGEWAKPWHEAGYNVIQFDIQHGQDVMDFNVEYFNDNWDISDVHAILAACPCTDFASSGSKHFAGKDKDGRTQASKQLVFQTLRTIEYFRPKVWTLENPVGRIEKLTGLPKARMTFNPNHFGAPYTKKTVLWGHFNAELPLAHVEPTEGSKMWLKYGGKSQATKNARSETPEGFAYAFFMANNYNDMPVERKLMSDYPEVSGAVREAYRAGVSEEQIREMMDKTYENYEYDDALEALDNAATKAIKSQPKKTAVRSGSPNESGLTGQELPGDRPTLELEGETPAQVKAKMAKADAAEKERLRLEQNDRTESERRSRAAARNQVDLFSTQNSLFGPVDQVGGEEITQHEETAKAITGDQMSLLDGAPPSEVELVRAPARPERAENNVMAEYRIAANAATDAVKDGSLPPLISEAIGKGLDVIISDVSKSDSALGSAQRFEQQIEPKVLATFLRANEKTNPGGGDVSVDDTHITWSHPVIGKLEMTRRDKFSAWHVGLSLKLGKYAPLSTSTFTAEQKKVDNYSGDLFGAALPTLTQELERTVRVIRQSMPVEPIPEAKFGTVTEPVTTGTLRAGYARVTSAEEAAHTLAGLRKSPQERFMILALDADKRPIAALHLHMGELAATMVSPEVAAKAVYQTPGVASIWYAHNHPSGIAEPSHADIRLTARLTTIFGAGTGIGVDGHVIIAGNKFTVLDQAGERVGAPVRDIPAAARTISIPITERRIKAPGFLHADQINSPTKSAQVIPKLLGGDAGIVFTDAQNRPVATLKMSASAMTKLRSGLPDSNAKHLFLAAGRANAGAVFMYFPPSEDADVVRKASGNIAGALNAANLRLLDILHGPLSYAEQGKIPSKETFNSRDAVTHAYDERAMRFEAIGQEVMSFFDRVLGGTPDLQVSLIEQRDPQGYAGRYSQGVKDIIQVALNARSPLSVAAHEGFHRIEMRHLTGQDRAVIARGIAKNTAMYNSVLETAKGYDDANGTELADEIEESPHEARAYAFQYWREGKLQADGAIAKVFQKIAQFIERVNNYLAGYGFKSVDDIFEAIDRGAYAKSNSSVFVQTAREAYGENEAQSTDLWNSMINDKVGTIAPLWYSALQRNVENLKLNSASPQQWKGTIKAMTQKGVKSAEIEETGVYDWLDLQDGKVSRDAVANYLKEKGVHVEETILGADAGESQATSEINTLKVDLDALGYNVVDDDINDLFGVERRSDGQFFSDDKYQDNDIANEHITPVSSLSDDVRTKVEQLGELLSARDDTYNARDNDTSKFINFTLPGGENYRELLLTMPEREIRTKDFVTLMPDGSPHGVFATEAEARKAADEIGGTYEPGESIDRTAKAGNFHSRHFSKPNILAHVRFKERYGNADGTSYTPPKKILFIEEIQSDWAQVAKRSGFARKIPSVGSSVNFSITESELQYHVADPVSGYKIDIGKGTVPNEEEARLYAARYFSGKIKDLSMANGGRPPVGPFVGKTEAWVSLAMKRMIRYAAEHGFDSVAWTNGEQQVERYDLSKHIKTISYSGSNLKAFDHHGETVISRTGVLAGDLPDIIGKDAAERLMAKPATGTLRTLEGMDLKLGGEGMREFYDKIVPGVTNDVLRKLGGGKIDQVYVSGIGDRTLKLFDTKQAATQWAEQNLSDHQYTVWPEDGKFRLTDDFTHEGVFVDNDTVRQQPGFEITPALRDSVIQQGMPLYSRDALQRLSGGDHDRLDSGMPGRVLYSNAALEGQSVRDIARRVQAGELPHTQLMGAIGQAIDNVKVPDSTFTKIFGAVKEAFKGGIARAYLSHFSTGNNVARYSDGYKNVFDVVTAYNQSKSRSIAENLDIGMSKWKPWDVKIEDSKAAGHFLMERTSKNLTTGSVEYQLAYAKLNAEQRAMVDQANTIVPAMLLAEFEADKAGYRTALGDEDYANWEGNRMQQIRRLIDEGYVPERRYGNFGVSISMPITTPDGVTKKIQLRYDLFENQANQELWYSNLVGTEKEPGPLANAGLTIERGTRFKPEYDASLSFKQFLDLAERHGVALSQTEREKIAKAMITADSTRRNRIFQRKNIPGYSEDATRVLSEFIVNVSNKVAYAQYGNAIQDALQGRQVTIGWANGKPTMQIDPDSKIWSNEGQNAGYYHGEAEKMVNAVVGPQEEQKWTRLAKMGATMGFLGGSIAFVPVQLSSIPINVVPYLTKSTSYTNALAVAFGALGNTVSNSGTLFDLAKLSDKKNKIEWVDKIPGFRDAMIRAGEDGTTFDTELYQLMGMTRGGLMTKSRATQKAAELWMKPFTWSEKANRISTFAAAYKIGMENNLTGDELYKFAQQAVFDTQIRYDMANRPAIMRNPIYALLFTFKTYPIAMGELIWNLFKEDKTAGIAMLGSLWIFAGVNGLPFRENLMDFIDTIAQRMFGQPFNSERWLRHHLKNVSEAVVGTDLSGVFLNGLVNSLTDLNTQSRVGLHNLIPGSRMGAVDVDWQREATQILGPLGSQAIGLVKGTGAFLKGDFQEALQKGGPSAVQNAIKSMQQFNTGYAVDANGQKLQDVTRFNAAMQFIGFSNASLANAYDKDRIDKQTWAYYTAVRADFIKDITKAVQSGDRDKVQDVTNLLAKWNETNPEMPIKLNAASLRRHIQQAGMPIEKRTLLRLPQRLRAGSFSHEEVLEK